MRYGLSIAAIGALAAAALYESFVALGVIGLGSEPGEGPPGTAWVLALALVAMLGGLGLAARGSRLVPPLAVTAAVFLVARFFTFDPYYLPSLRRMSDGGLVAPALVYLVVALALCAALLTRVRSRMSVFLAVPVTLACAFLAWVAGAGH